MSGKRILDTRTQKREEEQSLCEDSVEKEVTHTASLKGDSSRGQVPLPHRFWELLL